MLKKEKLTFTGHETFHCRNLWLKKGYDFVSAGEKFNDTAVLSLGIGRNMVSAVRYWMRAFGLLNDSDLLDQPMADLIFSDTGFDPYCEDKATMWLLHYMLVTTKKASIYSIVFNNFRKERVDFTKDQLADFIISYCKALNSKVQINSINRDIDTFLHNYFHKPSTKSSIAEELSGILQELHLVRLSGRSDGRDIYKIESRDNKDIHPLILLFCILKQMKGNLSINFYELLNGFDSVGAVFCFNANGLIQKIEDLMQLYPNDIVFSDDGGVRLLQIKRQFKAEEILRDYYATN